MSAFPMKWNIALEVDNMTIVTLMDDVAAFIRESMQGFATDQKGEAVQVEVYAGYPPERDKAKPEASCIWVLTTGHEDRENGDSIANLEIGFSIYDKDKLQGWRTLYNAMEHVRQALLRQRLIANKHQLILPLKSAIPEQGNPFPQWQAVITASYTIAQPQETFDFDSCLIPGNGFKLASDVKKE